MQAIVHIGSPKAGSSSIQEFLFLNADRLAARGVRFRRNVRGRGSQYEYPLAVMARSGTVPRGDMDRLRYRARTTDEALSHAAPHLDALTRFAQDWPGDSAVFSSEHILPWLDTPALIRAFDTAFSAAFDQVRYVAYYRAPYDHLVSGYSEMIKRGHTMTLDAFVRQPRAGGLNLIRNAWHWAFVVGQDRLDIRPFDRRELAGGDLITDFCAACGIDPDGLVHPPRANPALTAPGAEALRVLNGMVPELCPDGAPNPLRRELLDAVQDLTADMPKLALNKAQRAVVDARLDTPLKRFRKHFMPGRRALTRRRQGSRALPQAELGELAMQVLAELLVQTRLGQLPTLSRLERRRAHVTPRRAPTLSDTANMATAPDARPKRQNAGIRTQ